MTHDLRKRSYRGLVSSVVVLATALSGAATSQASSAQPSAPALPTSGNANPAVVSPLSPEQCAYGYYCGWQNTKWSGSFWYWGDPKNAWFYVGSSANDQISSDWNRHQNATYVAKDYPAGTYQFCISAGGSHESYVGGYYPQPPYPEVNDTISALYIKTSGC